uniref:Uncharacterized protein n=1 Tax=Acrobeloides nanus TaxID=290746 RepID=A0A914CDS2_9BILA
MKVLLYFILFCCLFLFGDAQLKVAFSGTSKDLKINTQGIEMRRISGWQSELINRQLRRKMKELIRLRHKLRQHQG